MNKDSAQLKNIINTSMARIKKQGRGCNIPSYGAAYRHNMLKDSIAVLVQADQVPKSLFTEISSDPAASLVTAIKTKFTIANRPLLVHVLQQLQDAHDDAFDEFRNQTIADPMNYFIGRCEQIKETL